jgi:hypothetical protein
MRSIGLRKLIGYGAIAATFAILLFAWMKWSPGDRIQKYAGANVAQLPLSFEVNRGQAVADATFVARGGGYTLLLTERGEPVLALGERSRQDPEGQRRTGLAGDLKQSPERAVLRLEFSGGNRAPQVQGEEPMAARSNYLIGNDPGKWLTGIPHYARVRYSEVFPGVDVLYYVKDQQLEYDFIVRPGTNPDSIRMRMLGAQGIGKDDSGSLALKTDAGSVVLHKPTAYQRGPNGEREVACDYLLDEGEIRFVLGDYDRSQVLRIDPVLSYSKTLDALIRAIAVDASGNTYLAGSTVSSNFPTTAHAFQHTNGGNADAVIAKLDPTGSSLLFATYLGGSAYDSANSIAIDSSGNVIVAGTTLSANLAIGHAFQSTLLGTEDAFLSKLNTDGSQLLYSTYLGGSGAESALGVALDSSGRAVMTGVTSSSNFPTTPGVLQAVNGGGADAFIAKLDTTKSGAASLLFSTYLGGSDRDAAGAIAVDATGNVFVTGLTISSNFPTANPLQSSCASCPSGSDTGLIPAVVADAFVTKLNATGTALVYSTFLGGNAGDAGNAIALDSVGNAYIAGTTFSWLNFPTTVGAFQTSHHGVGDAFVSKLNAGGSALLYSSFVGGDGDDGATGVALDSSGHAYLTGFTNSWDFPTVNPLQGPDKGVCDFVLFPDGCSDAVFLQMNADGSALNYSTYLGRSDINDSGTGIAADAAGNAYVAGATGIASFTDLLELMRFGFGPITSAGGFAAKISPVGVGSKATAIMLSSSPNPSSQAQPVTFTATVEPAGATGVVTFRDGKATIGSASVSAASTATLTHTSLSGGNHSITAEYLGDADFAASTSAALTHIVSSISLTTTQTSSTVVKGGTATFPLNVAQVGALSSAIAFSCSGLPAGWSCGFNPGTVPAGSGPTQVTLSLQTSSAAAQSLPHAPTGRLGLPGTIWAAVVVLLMLGVSLLPRRDETIHARPAIALGFAALLLLAAGCGAGSKETPPPTQPQTFTVNATSGGTTASIPLVITVR